jgi:hypothetical protein
MRYRKLTSDGDYSFGAGQLDFYRDVPEAVGQAALTRCQLWQGEWFLDTREGTLMLDGIIGKHSQFTADQTTRQRIQGTEGLIDIETFESEIDPETRVYSWRALLNTIYGPTLLETESQRNR